MLPKKLEKDLIIDAVFELRFVPNINSNAVFGILYNIFKDKYPNVENLNILDIPFQIREKDSNLLYQPHYRLQNELFQIRLGPRVLAVDILDEYPGWQKYFSEIKSIISSFIEANIAADFRRIALRYINLLEYKSIKDTLNIEFKINNEKYNKRKQSIITTVIEDENFQHNLRISENIEIEHTAKGINTQGTVLDIDTYTNDIHDFVTSYEEIIDSAHSKEKNFFFSLLQNSYLQTLRPSY
ncbi:MAG: TIGR04255 family protein [Candidatus Kapaibacterium sp.]